MRKLSLLLLISVLVIATCGLVYELVAGTLASYLLGDSVTQFSTIIGAYLFSMGIGSFLSRYFKGNLLRWFVQVEILVGLVGGTSSTVLFLCFEWVESFRLLLYFLIGLTGMLVGLEIPLLMRIFNAYKHEFKDIVSRVFTFDYMGALVASVVFPLILVPKLGIIRTSYFFGMLNVAVAVWLCLRPWPLFPAKGRLAVAGCISLVFLAAGFIYGDRILRMAEQFTYPDKIIYSKSSPYQRIVITRNANDIRLFLNGNLQFSSADEYRYHEALVHPLMIRTPEIQEVLILGGGDGLAAREVLRYPEVDSILLVDLDQQLTQLFRGPDMLCKLNQHSLSSSRLRIINQDAFTWLRRQQRQFDCVIVDFPDPSNFSVGKLYSQAFYRTLYQSVKPEGTVVVQSTSPLVAPMSFWCVDTTMQSVGFYTRPYHCYVPSFGEWGFIMARRQDDFRNRRPLPGGMRFMSETTLAQMENFPPDMARRHTEVNRLNNQVLVHYFEKEWAHYLH